MSTAIPQDEEHLRLLSVFHYVVAVLIIMFSSIFIIHVVMGIMFLVAPDSFKGTNGNGAPAPAFIGWLFIIIGSGAVFFGWATGVCFILAGRFLARRKRYMFCFVVAIIGCLFMPFGTVLGVFTILVLSRPSVKAMFVPQVQPLST